MLPTCTSGPTSAERDRAHRARVVLIGAQHGTRARQERHVAVRERGQHAGRARPRPAGEESHRSAEGDAELPRARLADVRDGRADRVGHALARPGAEDDRRRPVRLRRFECEPARAGSGRRRRPELVVRDVAADARHPERPTTGGRHLSDAEAAARALLAAADRPAPERPEAARRCVPEPHVPAVALRLSDGPHDRAARDRERRYRGDVRHGPAGRQQRQRGRRSDEADEDQGGEEPTHATDHPADT